MLSESRSIFAIKPPVSFSLPGRRSSDKASSPLIHRLRFERRRSQSRDAVSQFMPQSRPPMEPGHDSKKTGWAMTEQEDRIAREREEIAARVASFKATQQ